MTPRQATSWSSQPLSTFQVSIVSHIYQPVPVYQPQDYKMADIVVLYTTQKCQSKGMLIQKESCLSQNPTEDPS